MSELAFRELFGTLGSLTIFLSMCFNTETTKGKILLRVFNLIGSLFYVIYGQLLSAYSSIIMNSILVFVNGYYIIKIIKNK